jgi:hypothetical protein
VGVPKEAKAIDPIIHCEPKPAQDSVAAPFSAAVPHTGMYEAGKIICQTKTTFIMVISQKHCCSTGRTCVSPSHDPEL